MLKEIVYTIKRTIFRFGLPIIHVWKKDVDIIPEFQIIVTPTVGVLTPIFFLLTIVGLLIYFIIFIPLVWAVWFLNKITKRKINKRKAKLYYSQYVKYYKRK